MNDGGGEIDIGREAQVGFVGAHGNPLEFLELAEEVLDQMTPCVHLLTDGERLRSARVLRDHRLGSSLVEFRDDPIAVEGSVRDQGVKGDAAR